MVDPLRAVLGAGLQIVVTPKNTLRVFGEKHIEENRREAADQFIKKNAALLRTAIEALETLRASIPGYCPTCPAYARDWPRTHKRKVHTEWCVHDAYFAGKSGTPIMMRRYDPELEAFYLIFKRKEISCPRLKSANS